MKLVAGLGNPGPSYTATRHNVGFWFVDALESFYRFPSFKKGDKAHFSEQTIGGTKTFLLKPQTYMNLSGEAVGPLMRYYKLSPEDVWVIHDDLDLLPGKVKVKKGGSNGGHNGLRNIEQHIGPDFWRIRIGIGHPGDKSKVSDFVLSPFLKSEQEKVRDVIGDLVPRMEDIIGGNYEIVLSQLYNQEA